MRDKRAAPPIFATFRNLMLRWRKLFFPSSRSSSRSLKVKIIPNYRHFPESSQIFIMLRNANVIQNYYWRMIIDKLIDSHTRATFPFPISSRNDKILSSGEKTSYQPPSPPSGEHRARNFKTFITNLKTCINGCDRSPFHGEPIKCVKHAIVNKEKFNIPVGVSRQSSFSFLSSRLSALSAADT